MKKKLIFIMALAFAVAALIVFSGGVLQAEEEDAIMVSVKNGFLNEGGELYYYQNNVKVSGWFTIDGVTYYASKTTNVVINYDKNIGGKYYVWNDATGLTLANGFVNDGVGTKCYYNGYNVIGWHHADGTGPSVVDGVFEQYSENPTGLYYFLSTTGYMVTDDTYTIGGYTREFNEDHTVKPLNGLQTNLGCKYYYVNGVKQTGWQTIDGVTYYFMASDDVYGQAASRWMYIGNKVYYFYASTSATPYALKTSGTIGGIAYNYDTDGHIIYNGFVNCEYANNASDNTADNIQKKNSTTRYYVNGEMQTGWQTIDGNKYYFYKIGSANGSGYMCCESRTIGGVWYNFASDGAVEILKNNPLEGKKISIFGDSISTFEGYLTPSTNKAFYDTADSNNTGVTSHSLTWWGKLCETHNGILEINNSYSNSFVNASIIRNGVETIQKSAFINRVEDNNLGSPDYILICSGTNDDFQNDLNEDHTLVNLLPKDSEGNVISVGFSELTSSTAFNDEVKKSFKGAFAYVIVRLKELYPDAQIVNITYSAVRSSTGVKGAIAEICDVYGVQNIVLSGIETADSIHPTEEGMLQFYKQVAEALGAI